MNAGNLATVAVLCARKRSIYRQVSGVEVYDRDRDARTFAGGMPVVCHPPCAQWGRLKGFAKCNVEEKELGPFCVEMVRQFGGVLEHPAASTLWHECKLPLPGDPGSPGQFTLSISQAWFGHRGDKATWLFIAGVDPREILLPPPVFRGSRKVESMGLAERESTPADLASWLVELARSSRK